MKKIIMGMFCFILAISIFGCQKKETEGIDTVKGIEPDLTDMAISPLTGLYIDGEDAKIRPVAIVINNLHKALPQSGIGDADIYYEVLAEGEITRIIAIFQVLNAEKIGPVRSARDYFTYFALDNDAILIHHGGSPSAYVAIPNRSVDNIDGMANNNFFRDKTRVNTPSMYEHSSYIDSDGIKESILEKDYRDYIDEDIDWGFNFYDQDTKLVSDVVADDVVLAYSYYQISEFLYNEANGVYERIQSGEPQIDETTGETLTVKNIIIQYTNTYMIANDEAGRRGIDLVGSGDGKLITMGNAIDITWKKERYSSPTVWYDTNGNEMLINKGKTWICVYPIGYTITLTSELEESEKIDE